MEASDFLLTTFFDTMPDMNAYVQWQERERKMGNSGENPDKTIPTISIPSEHSIRLAIDTVITEACNHYVSIWHHNTIMLLYHISVNVVAMSTSWKLVNNSLVLREGLEYCRDTLIKEKKNPKKLSCLLCKHHVFPVLAKYLFLMWF